MAVRTASQRAYLIGEGEFRKQTGRTLVIISKNNTSCEKCRPFESKVLIDDVYSGGKAEDGDYMLLSTAMSLGLFHPRCRHGCGTYFPELEDITGYDSPNNRLNDYGVYDKSGSADDQNIAKYQKRLDYWQEQEKALSAQTVDNEAENGIINAGNSPYSNEKVYYNPDAPFRVDLPDYSKKKMKFYLKLVKKLQNQGRMT